MTNDEIIMPPKLFKQFSEYILSHENDILEGGNDFDELFSILQWVNRMNNELTHESVIVKFVETDPEKNLAHITVDGEDIPDEFSECIVYEAKILLPTHIRGYGDIETKEELLKNLDKFWEQWKPALRYRKLYREMEDLDEVL